MSSQQHSQSFEDDCSLSDFDSAGLSLCNVSKIENFTENSNLEIQTGSVEIVNVTNEGVQSASHDPTSYPSPICLPSVLGPMRLGGSFSCTARHTGALLTQLTSN